MKYSVLHAANQLHATVRCRTLIFLSLCQFGCLIKHTTSGATLTLFETAGSEANKQHRGNPDIWAVKNLISSCGGGNTNAAEMHV